MFSKLGMFRWTPPHLVSAEYAPDSSIEQSCLRAERSSQEGCVVEQMKELSHTQAAAVQERSKLMCARSTIANAARTNKGQREANTQPAIGRGRHTGYIAMYFCPANRQTDWHHKAQPRKIVCVCTQLTLVCVSCTPTSLASSLIPTDSMLLACLLDPTNGSWRCANFNPHKQFCKQVVCYSKCSRPYTSSCYYPVFNLPSELLVNSILLLLPSMEI